MNYDHLYHAGNFSDVVKHITLMALFNALHRKQTPFCYIDTHAGSGYYDLSSNSANKTKEYVNGIERIIAAEQPPALVRRYLDLVHRINDDLTHSKHGSLRYYPGSPLIAKQSLRPNDRAVLCELEQTAYQNLKATLGGDKQVAIHHLDGFLGLKAFIPPTERRGVVLIDPPYEDPDEFNRLAHSLPSALKRWETGIYAIWYPIKEKAKVEHFYHTLKTSIAQPILAIELTVYPDLPHHLNGCGLTIINPPWQFDSAMHEVLPWLWKTLSINAQGAFRTYSLK